jgi:hypothetical protein
MPQSGVSVPRGNVRRGERRSDELELEVPARRERPERRAISRATPPPVRALQHDPYDLHLDLHVEFDLITPPVNRAASRPEPVRPSAVARPEPPRPSAAAAERRTVTIQGRPSDRYRPPAGTRRRQPPPHQRAGFQPDRVAMWAVFLGLALLLVAATSSHAAMLSVHGLAMLAR